jgi:uncharacterized protein YqkB
MKIECTPEAIDQLKARFGSPLPAFRFVYDTEGCGCAVNGVPALWATSSCVPGDVPAESQTLAIWHDPRHALFFEDRLRISWLPERGSFTLAGDGQIYTTRLTIQDRRNG